MEFLDYLGDAAAIKRDAAFCSVQGGDVEAILAAAAAAGTDAAMAERLSAVATAISGNSEEWKAAPWRDFAIDPRGNPPHRPEQAFLLVLPVLFCLSATREAYAVRKIPECILAETMRDLPRWIDTFAERSAGRFRGFAEIGWLRESLSLRLFQLGRLQFQPGEFGGEPVINVHIPSGAPLGEAQCRQSFEVAPHFFAKYFPDAPIAHAKKFVCESWLLSSELEDALPDGSNIKTFAKMFRCGSASEDDGSAAFDRVFPAKGTKATDADASSSLQKLLLKLRDKGLAPHSRAGEIALPLPARKLRLGVLGSGSGSNMQSIQDAIEAGTLNAEIAVVLTDVPGARILDRAARHGLPAAFVDHAPFKTKLEGRAEDEVIRILRDAKVDVVVLAGYMRVVKPKLLAAYPDRVINIHPALLPSFPGIAGWKQALDYGAKVAGCTVHFVNAGIDSGPIIVQKSVPVEDADTPESLHARIQVQEHVAYPEALRLLAAGRLLVCGRRVITL